MVASWLSPCFRAFRKAERGESASESRRLYWRRLRGRDARSRSRSRSRSRGLIRLAAPPSTPLCSAAAPARPPRFPFLLSDAAHRWRTPTLAGTPDPTVVPPANSLPSRHHGLRLRASPLPISPPPTSLPTSRPEQVLEKRVAPGRLMGKATRWVDSAQIPCRPNTQACDSPIFLKSNDNYVLSFAFC